MSEEPWIVATQQTLGTLITKPKLGEKYLKKPPFRFLHDALTEVIRATGFGQGLYSDSELDASNIGDKQAKLDFLNKMIGCVCFALGERIDVSANKIVAGLEPEKTNGFLVKLHEAATTKLDASPEAVERVKSGETIGDKKKEKKEKKEKGDGEERKEKKEKKEKKEEKPDEEERKAAEKSKREAARKAEKEREKAEKAEREKAEKAAAEKAGAEKAAADKAAAEKAAADKAAAEKAAAEKKRAERAAADKAAQEKAAAAAAERAAAEVPVSTPPADVAAEPQPELPGPGKRERPLTAGRKPPKISSKVKEQRDMPGQEPVEGPALIVEGQDDDAEDMFVDHAMPVQTLTAGDDQGKLTRELLAQKEEEKKKSEEATKEEEDTAGKAKSGIRMGKIKRHKDHAGPTYSEVDVPKLTSRIQQLCQTVNPLGKSIDMVYQDIASMTSELERWKSEYRTATERLQSEREQTEKELAPLYSKLASVDDTIAEQNARIQGIRTRILQNDKIIHNLLETIAYPG